MYRIQNEILTLEVDPVGAELHALHSAGGPEWGHLWDGGPAWPRRAPVCFPWCGRIRDGYYEEAGARYDVGIHGLLRDMPHTLLEQGEGTLTLRAESDDAALKQYPWRFRADTTHALEGKTVVTTVTVTNLDTRPMPAQFGFHTALRCPFTPGGSAEDYIVRFEREEEPVENLMTAGFVTGETRPVFTGQSVVPLQTHMFDNDSICMSGLKSRWVQLEERATGRALRLGIEGYPYVVLWSPVGIPGFFCIEPWGGMPSRASGERTLWARPGTTTVHPGETLTSVQALTVI